MAGEPSPAPAPPAPPAGRVPFWVKLAYTAFVVVLVPVYWYYYGPTNFLYFCDVALLMTVAALWLESPLLASMPAVGILLPQALWCADFLSTAVGIPMVGLTGYMFDANRSLFLRGLSFFHFWLPFFLVWLVWKLGYDQRALVAWTVLAWALVLVCYAFLPPPPAPADNTNLPVNVNYVYGFDDAKAQDMLPEKLWVAGLMVGLPVVIFWPTHWVLQRYFRREAAPVLT